MCLLLFAFLGLVQHEAHLLLCLEAKVIRAFCFFDGMHGDLHIDFASIFKILDGILVAENLQGFAMEVGTVLSKSKYSYYLIVFQKWNLYNILGIF